MKPNTRHTSHTFRILTMVFVTLGLLPAAELSAQRVPATSRRAPDRSNTLNTAVGAQLHGSTLNFNGEGAEFGIGGGIFAGFGFTRKVMMYGEYDAARININSPGIEGTYTLAKGDIGLRYSFANEKRAWIPYVSAAFAIRRASTQVPAGGGTQDFSFSGYGYSVGGGTQYFLTHRFALDFGYALSRGELSKVKVGNSPIKSGGHSNSTSNQFSVGLKFYPQVREER